MVQPFGSRIKACETDKSQAYQTNTNQAVDFLITRWELGRRHLQFQLRITPTVIASDAPFEHPCLHNAPLQLCHNFAIVRALWGRYGVKGC